MKRRTSTTRGRLLYFIASPENPTQLYLYRVARRSRRAERVTPAAAGARTYAIAPGGHFAMHTCVVVRHAARRPICTPAGSRASLRTLSTTPRWARSTALALGPVEFFAVDIGDGVKLDGWMIKPPGFDSTKKYPVLSTSTASPPTRRCATRGAGALPVAPHARRSRATSWSSVDNRGTPAPRGAILAQGVYNRSACCASREQAAAARVIAPAVRRLRRASACGAGAAAARSTLNLMFRAPDVYKTGMAVAPVADLHYYDTIYQERYVGLPQHELDGVLRRGSPLNFADGLRGDLLLVHGSGDDNVHFQSTEQLINALVAADKPFQMMEYPNRTHGICEGPGTTLHLFNLLTRYLRSICRRGEGREGRCQLRRRKGESRFSVKSSELRVVSESVVGSLPSVTTIVLTTHHSELITENRDSFQPSHPAFNSLYHASNARWKKLLLNIAHSPSDGGSVNAAPASAAVVPAA